MKWFLRLLALMLGAVLGIIPGSFMGFVWAYASTQQGRFHNTDEIYAAEDVGMSVGGWAGAILGALLVLTLTNWSLRPEKGSEKPTSESVEPPFITKS